MNADLRLQIENQQYPAHLEEWPRKKWPTYGPLTLMEVWRSRDFLVQVHNEDGFVRLSINRTRITPTGDWQEGITWDEIQRLKSECGHGDKWAVECYPPDKDVVNVANIRHVFLLTEPPAFGWHKGGKRGRA